MNDDTRVCRVQEFPGDVNRKAEQYEDEQIVTAYASARRTVDPGVQWRAEFADGAMAAVYDGDEVYLVADGQPDRVEPAHELAERLVIEETVPWSDVVGNEYVAAALDELDAGSTQGQVRNEMQDYVTGTFW